MFYMAGRCQEKQNRIKWKKKLKQKLGKKKLEQEEEDKKEVVRKFIRHSARREDNLRRDLHENHPARQQKTSCFSKLTPSPALLGRS